MTAPAVGFVLVSRNIGDEEFWDTTVYILKRTRFKKRPYWKLVWWSTNYFLKHRVILDEKNPHIK